MRLSRPLTPPVSSITGRAAGPGLAGPLSSAAAGGDGTRSPQSRRAPRSPHGGRPPLPAASPLSGEGEGTLPRRTGWRVLEGA